MLDVIGEFSDIKIRVRKWFLKCTITIPENLKIAILAFLREYRNGLDPNFDCYAFAESVVGIKTATKQKLWTKWSHKKLEGEPSPGDIIFLLDEKNNMFKHAAVYLGLGYYISVHGAGGELVISKLDRMQADFSAPDVKLATPK